MRGLELWFPYSESKGLGDGVTHSTPSQDHQVMKKWAVYSREW